MHTTTPTVNAHISERVAHGLLTLVGDLPGQVGRLRCARIVGGYPVAEIDSAHTLDPAPSDQYDRYAVAPEDWPLRLIVELVDALIVGRLIVQSIGARPTLALTRAGFRALEALDHERDQQGADALRTEPA